MHAYMLKMATLCVEGRSHRHRTAMETDGMRAACETDGMRAACETDGMRAACETKEGQTESMRFDVATVLGNLQHKNN